MIIILLLAGVKLLIPLLTHSDFQFQRDEFLYMAMADHLSWGYLEVPPFIAVISRVAGMFFGDSLFAMRFLPAFSGAVTLVLTGLIAREMGGGRFALILAGVSYLFSLVYLRMNLLLQPVTFDCLFFVLGTYLFIRILKTAEAKYWILLGIVVGFGLLNKYTMLLFGFGVATGLLFTSYRRMYLTRWPYISAGIAFLIWLPNLIWQYQHNWPFFEHMKVLAETQLSNMNPVMFLLAQLLMNFFSAPIWLAGLYSLFFGQLSKKFRPVGWIYLSMLLLLLLLSGKVYYLGAAYPMLLAAGSAAVEGFIRKHSIVWLKPVVFGVVVIGNLALVPVGIPVFSIQAMIDYFKFGTKYLGIESALRWESGKLHELPQDFADMLGWESLTSATAQVYNQLPDSTRQHYAIYAANYGEAGAIYYYGKKYNLPVPISNSGSFWLWGYREVTGEYLITVGSDRQDVEYYYRNVSSGTKFLYPHARESGIEILKANGLKITIEELWEIMKKYRW
ncbi:MAG: phospholipid carrier-dependent glycosyltransferase [Calditrichaeota bacterium]|nr:glycosyltransferase family 39 protein [Calditrichota bacterium]RQV99760.1 MAG: phospholipid carrier-dependent glycosyltransferase [Calditrichota bacterium]